MTADWRDELPVLRPTSSRELWRQLHDQLSDRILSGAIPADEKLWTQVELAEALGVSRGTTIRAYSVLKEDGLVIFASGKGVYTADEAALAKLKKKRR
jgi:DNA-binding transcriptional regulator YhcF (GntR family)